MKHRNRRCEVNRRRGEKGFSLIVGAASILVLIGMVGLAVDLGRMYIAKGEAQIYTDSASIAATMELDGTQSGISRAVAQVQANTNKWNFQTSDFTSVQISFAKSPEGPWEESPLIATNYAYARVTANVSVPVYFLSLFMLDEIKVTPTTAGFIAVAPTSFTKNVRGDSDAGQEPQETFREGLFPFSPFAHNDVGPHYGLEVGEYYTFRWAAEPRLNNNGNSNNNNVCSGDRKQAIIDLAESGGGSERGFIEETSGGIIREAIIANYQTAWRGIGDAVNMTGGAKQAMRDAINERISQDGNWWSETYAGYVASGLGNGRRVVAMPINAGYPTYRVKQIGAFFLGKLNQYGAGGNTEWCAEYLGSWVMGAKTKGAMDGAGAYVVRLVD